MRDLLRGLADERGLGLVMALLENGKMAFGEMRDSFGLSQSSMSALLKKLQDGNLVRNFYEKGDGRGFSYYEATDLSKQAMDSLFEVMYSRGPSTLVANGVAARHGWKDSDDRNQSITGADWIPRKKTPDPISPLMTTPMAAESFQQEYTKTRKAMPNLVTAT